MVSAVIQLLTAERLEQRALRDLRDDAAIGEALSNAPDRPAALPDIQEIRNALPISDWAFGRGRGPQREGVASGSETRDVAAAYWGLRPLPGRAGGEVGAASDFRARRGASGG